MRLIRIDSKGAIMTNAKIISTLRMVWTHAGGSNVYSLGDVVVDGRILEAEIELGRKQQSICEVCLSTRFANDPDIGDMINDGTITALLGNLAAHGIEVERDDISWAKDEVQTEEVIRLEVRIAKDSHASRTEGVRVDVPVAVAAAALMEWSAKRRWGVAKDRKTFEAVLKRAMKEASE